MLRKGTLEEVGDPGLGYYSMGLLQHVVSCTEAIMAMGTSD